MEKNYSISEAAKKLGVSIKTLQRWDREGRLIANRTLGNRRYYTENQLSNIAKGSFDAEDIYDVIKNRYVFMIDNHYELAGGNIMGHIVYNLFSMQDADRDSFFDSYDNTTIDGVKVAVCDVWVKLKNLLSTEMSIIAVPLDTDNAIALNWLYRRMLENDAHRGILIKGTEWVMVNNKNDEYHIDFMSDEIDINLFEKFITITDTK